MWTKPHLIKNIPLNFCAVCAFAPAYSFGSSLSVCVCVYVCEVRYIKCYELISLYARFNVVKKTNEKNVSNNNRWI